MMNCHQCFFQTNHWRGLDNSLPATFEYSANFENKFFSASCVNGTHANHTFSQIGCGSPKIGKQRNTCVIHTHVWRRRTGAINSFDAARQRRLPVPSMPAMICAIIAFPEGEIWVGSPWSQVWLGEYKSRGRSQFWAPRCSEYSKDQ